MSFETVTEERQGALGIVTLNRPQVRNALNRQLRFDLNAALENAINDAEVRVILLRGEGKSFSAGHDLGEELEGFGDEGFIVDLIRNEYVPIINTITNAPKPIIGVLNGAVAGIGVSIAMACDLLIMEEESFLYCAFGAIGLVPDGGLHLFLRNALGSKKAYEMIAFSQRLTAQQCKQQGIANRVVTAGKLQEEAIAFGEELSQKPPMTLSHSKQLLAEAADNDLAKIMDREAVIQDINIRSGDFKEGTAAFFEKRPPNFKGC